MFHGGIAEFGSHRIKFEKHNYHPFDFYQHRGNSSCFENNFLLISKTTTENHIINLLASTKTTFQRKIVQHILEIKSTSWYNPVDLAII